MNALILLVLATFLIALVLGWRHYRAFFWNYVDLIYYPLAAVGVSLLFVSNDVQRELLEVTQFHEKESTALAELKTNKPDIRITDTANLLGSNVDHIALIARWVETCRGVPSTSEAMCLAAKNLGPPVAEFLKVARGEFSNYEDRLLSTCAAGDKLLEDVRSSQAISTLVMDKLLAQYLQVTALKLSSFEYEAFNKQVDEFKKNATAYAEQIHRLAFKPEDNSGQILLGIRKAEIEYGEILLRGLSQCISAPRTELGLLQKWTSATSTKEQEVKRLEIQRQQLKQVATRHPTSLWLQLNLWPLVLIVALSLKFAKGAATLRKARQSAA